MIQDSDLDFLIGGNINEPVAMEIPFDCRTVNTSALINFLIKHGLEVDFDGQNPKNFSLTTRQDQYGYCSLITPAMEPSELKDTFRLFEKLFTIFISPDESSTPPIKNPHILDLKNLVTQNQNMEKDKGLIETLLNEAEQSKELVKFKYPSNDLKNYFKDTKHLFSGTAMSDPYAVATTWYGKYFRYASWDPDDAARYNQVCGWTKNFEVSFTNMLPNGQPVGFLHEYVARPDQEQLYYPDFGIQKNGVGSSAHDRETMVNRFNNPVVATYVLWKKQHDNNIYMIKIPENDPRWEAFKNYYKANLYEQDQAKRNKIEHWIAEGEEHKTYLPWADKTMHAHDMLESINQMSRERAIKRHQAKEHKEQLIVKIKDLCETIKGIKDNLKFFDIHNQRSCSYYDGIITEIKDAISEYNQRISVLKNLKQEAENLKKEAENFEQEARTSGIYFELKYTDANYNLTLIAEKIQKNNENIKEAEKDIDKALELKKNSISNKCEWLKNNPEEINQNIESEVKEALMESMRESFSAPLDKIHAEKLSDTIINLYRISSPQERISFETYFEYIKENASKEVLNVLVKRAKSKKLDIIANSVKTPLGERIKQLLGFVKGKQKLMNEMDKDKKQPIYSDSSREQ